MPFSTHQLANQLNDPNLPAWAGSTLANQAPMIAPFTAYFNAVQNWITMNGGNGPAFGWNDVNGLQSGGVQVVLQGPQQRAPFNDAFDDTRAHLGQPTFRLFQSASAFQRLMALLPHL